jgi:uncharacterized tellurite resistance protein B-like protein
MFETFLRRLLAPEPTRLPDPEAHLALAALMVRAARTDGHYTAPEIARIDRVLAAHLSIGPTEAAKLRAEAEVLETEAPDTVRFTRALKAATALEDRSHLMQALWSVALADGAREAQEDQLMRMVASLLGLSDVQSALARQRAERE